ncbi:MAG: hypothetical protein IPH13_16045 [Planctomycetes bacterium]|nr:hypothetical protein [Planctomycetota bacterium]
MSIRAGVLVVASLGFLGSAHADLSKSVNPIVRGLRLVQNEDGSYGAREHQPLATARALQGFGRCSEKYTTQDGPFVRNAVAALLAYQQADGAFAAPDDPLRSIVTKEAWKALDLVAKTADYDAAKAKTKAFLDAEASRALNQDDADHAVDRALGGLGAGGVDAHDAAELEALAKEPVTVDNAHEMADVLLAVIDAVEREAAAKPKAATDDKPVADAPRRALPKDAAERAARIDEALAFLAAQQRDGRFGFEADSDAGVTGITLTAVMRTCDAAGRPHPEYVAQGLAWLASLQKEDGGIYEHGLKNYITSVTIEALATSKDQRYRPVIDQAVGFLELTQLDEGEGYSSEEDNYYGGFGYGSAERPDLSNSHFAIEALHAAGVPTDREAYTKAVEFLRRCQNLEETGPIPVTRPDGKVAVAGSDGGAQYRPGDSKAGDVTNADGTVSPRSYGSMTYALLKSYLFAGLDPKDAKVQAAIGWIQQNFTLDVNPGFVSGKGAEYQGLYYYYVTLGRALEAYGQDTITDGKGRSRAWKRELADTVLALQTTDGYWINHRSARWMEGNKVLTTAYALLALDTTR